MIKWSDDAWYPIPCRASFISLWWYCIRVMKWGQHYSYSVRFGFMPIDNLQNQKWLWFHVFNSVRNIFRLLILREMIKLIWMLTWSEFSIEVDFCCDFPVDLQHMMSFIYIISSSSNLYFRNCHLILTIIEIERM